MPTELEEYAEVIEALDTIAPEVESTNWNPGQWRNDFFKQRTGQRNLLFIFAIVATSVSLLFFIIIVAIQMYYKIKFGPNFAVISDTALEIIAVAVFAQMLGVVIIIAHALWSNHEFKIISEQNNKE